jgi:mannitol-specific phosphotransferase system IIBC component
MSSVSFLEQLTSSVSLSMVTIISAAILAFILIYTVASRLLFSSKSKSIPIKQHLAKDKKPKESNTKKQATETTPANDKKKKSKIKKNVVVVPSSSSSSSSIQSEESEDEKATLVTPPKKVIY